MVNALDTRQLCPAQAKLAKSLARSCCARASLRLPVSCEMELDQICVVLDEVSAPAVATEL